MTSYNFINHTLQKIQICQTLNFHNPDDSEAENMSLKLYYDKLSLYQHCQNLNIPKSPNSLLVFISF